MQRPKVYHIFQTGRPTKFKLGTQMNHEEDPYHRQAPYVTSKVRGQDRDVTCCVSEVENKKSQKHQNW